MSPLISAEGVASLRAAWLGWLVSLAVAVVAIGATRAHRHAEERSLANARLLLSQAEARLGRARRDRDSLGHAVAAHRQLAARGLFTAEDRLGLVSHLTALKAEFRLASLEFDIDPQRPVSVAGLPGESLKLFASRIRFTLRTRHEGHALAFVEAARAWPRGVLLLTSCSLRRLPDTAPGPRVESSCAAEWLTVQPRAGAIGAP